MTDVADGIVEVEPDHMTPLQAVRWELARAVEGAPWPIHVGPVDAVAGPCLMILSGAREPLPAFGCNYTTRPVVLLVAGRVDPGPAVDELDAQECWVLPRLPWPVDRVDEEELVAFAGVQYLARRVVTRTTVTIRGDG